MKMRHGLAVALGAACLLLIACSTDDTADIRFDRAAFKNVVIFNVDTLRADRLGVYGYGRQTSPNVDGFADDAVVFGNAFSVSPWTRTSVVSLFTSMNPVAHACQDRDDSARDELVMMAEIFRANGFVTGGFSTNISVSEKFNLAQGFDDFVYFERKPWFSKNRGRPDPGYVPIEGMMDDALGWLDNTGDKPFFFYFHPTDPHWQYRAPAIFTLWGREQLGDLYDAEILYVDHYFGQLIEHLRTLGKLDETLVIFTSDHGEELFDHGGHGHGHTLFNELLRVPLIFRHPQFETGIRPEIVRQTDILPTLIDLFALERSGAVIQGRSIVPMLFDKRDPTPEDQYVLAEVIYPSKIEGISLEMDGWKLMRIFQMQKSRGFPAGVQDSRMLYETSRDPHEQNDVARDNPAVVDSLEARMLELRNTFDVHAVQGKDTELDDETRDALRSLGYVE
jgi:arylsulfatase A-like enzyme